MNVSLLTSHEAADLLGVHESSIKRWCDSGALRCRRTAGGHRRIELNSLLQLAQEQDIPCALLVFDQYADDLWKALSPWFQRNSLFELRGLLYRWVMDARNEYTPVLVRYLNEIGIPTVRLFDDLITPVLRQTGEQWVKGEIEIGDEHRVSQAIFDALYTLRQPNRQKNRTNGEVNKTAVVGCTEGNLHEMGAQMVRCLLEEKGWRVIYLGPNVPSADLAHQQAKHGASLLCVSFCTPQIPADIHRMVHTLSHFYDRDNPYDLVVGGNIARSIDLPHVSEYPFRAFHYFDRTEHFQAWTQDRNS